MIKQLIGLLSRPKPLPPTATVSTPRVSVEMHWLPETALPIPDWQRMGEVEQDGFEGEAVHNYWTSAAWSWLERLGEELDACYRIRQSADFLLMSSLDDRAAELFLAGCQRMLARIKRGLGTLADDGGWGKYVVVVFNDLDSYYTYVAHYQPEGGEYAMSSGMFIQAEYGHFVMPQDAIDAMEPVIAHELTHCLLTHLPIPAWLNEGLAVNTEHTLFPQLAAPHAQLFFPHEVAAHHAAYWDADSIQMFWSGKSFLRADDGNRLSYDLAQKITALAAKDELAFRAFVHEAKMEDGGLSAEHHLGFPIAHLIEAVLGEGSWQPRPETWNEGVEGGQF